MTALRLLGVTEAPLGATLPEDVSAVLVGDIMGLVRRADTAGASPLAALRLHDTQVRELAARLESFLPARFGQTYTSATALETALASRTTALTAALATVRGAVQMIVRIPTPPAAPGSRGDADLGPGRRYLDTRRRARAPSPLVAELRQALDSVVRAERVERSTERPLTSVYHLVPRERLAGYQAALQAVVARSDVPLTTSGPWAAYAFAEVT